MRKLNIKFLFFLLIGLFVLAGALFGVHRLQAGNIASGLLFQANQAEQEGRLQQSARYLVRYLEFAPRDSEQRRAWAKCSVTPNSRSPPRRQRARFIIDQVLIKDANRADLRKCLVRLALDENNLDAAAEQLQILNKLAPDDGEVAALWGQWHERSPTPPGKTDYQNNAYTDYRRAIELAPDLVDGYIRFINLLRKKDQGQMGRFGKEAAQCAEQALQRFPTDIGVLIAAAEVAQDQSQPDKAQEHLTKALSLAGKEAAFIWPSLRWTSAGDNRPRPSTACATPSKSFLNKTALNYPGRSPTCCWMPAKSKRPRSTFPRPRPWECPTLPWIFSGRTCSMAESLVRRYHPARAHPRYLQGGSRVATRKPTYTWANAMGSYAKPARQLAAYERVLKVQPTNITASQGLAAALTAMGRHDPAILVYKQVAKLGVDLQQPTGGQLNLARRYWSAISRPTRPIGTPSKRP